MTLKKRVLSVMADNEPWELADLSAASGLTPVQIKDCIGGMRVAGQIETLQRGGSGIRAVYQITEEGHRKLEKPSGSKKPVVKTVMGTVQMAIRTQPVSVFHLGAMQ